jgi:hypothetical protein
VEGGNIFNLIGRIPDFLRGKIRDNYPPKFREVRDAMQMIKIVSMSVVKQPIQANVSKLGSLITLGGLDKAKKQFNYDDLYHLFILFKTGDGRSFRIEKNQVLALYEYDHRLASSSPSIDIPINQDVLINLEVLLTNLQGNLRPEELYLYSGNKYNCQHFVWSFLSFNNLIPFDIRNELESFVLQDTDGLFKFLGTHTTRLAQGITDLAGAFDYFLYGARLDDGQKKEEL